MFRHAPFAMSFHVKEARTQSPHQVLTRPKWLTFEHVDVGRG